MRLLEKNYYSTISSLIIGAGLFFFNTATTLSSQEIVINLQPNAQKELQRKPASLHKVNPADTDYSVARLNYMSSLETLSIVHTDSHSRMLQNWKFRRGIITVEHHRRRVVRLYNAYLERLQYVRKLKRESTSELYKARIIQREQRLVTRIKDTHKKKELLRTMTHTLQSLALGHTIQPFNPPLLTVLNANPSETVLAQAPKPTEKPEHKVSIASSSPKTAASYLKFKVAKSENNTNSLSQPADPSIQPNSRPANPSSGSSDEILVPVSHQ